MNIFNANYNPGSVPYYKTDATSRSISGGKPNHARPTRDRDFHEEDIENIAESRVVETFGVVDRNGKEILTGWKLDGSRKDEDTKSKATGWSHYGAELNNAMFKGW